VPLAFATRSANEIWLPAISRRYTPAIPVVLSVAATYRLPSAGLTAQSGKEYRGVVTASQVGVKVLTTVGCGVVVTSMTSALTTRSPSGSV
jgi:hypothetical protein